MLWCQNSSIPTSGMGKLRRPQGQVCGIRTLKDEGVLAVGVAERKEYSRQKKAHP